MQGSWERDVLKAVGAPVTAGNLRLLRTWQRWEGGHTKNKATYNWLNTTRGKQFPGVNSVGVRAFPDYRTGVAYTADTILGGYPSVVSALRSGKPYSTKWRDRLLADFSKWVSGSRTANLEYGRRVLGMGSSSPRAPMAAAPKRSLQFIPKSRNDLSLGSLASALDDGDDFWDLVQANPIDVPEMSMPASPAHAMTQPAPTGKGFQAPVLRNGANVKDGWGGSYSIAKGLSNVAKNNGLSVMSEKRDRKNTASGGVSDHWVGSKTSYAFDLSNGSSPTKEMDRTARQLLSQFGAEWDGKSPIVFNTNHNGYRIQILYRTNVGGNHFNHIHVGVRKL